MSAENELTANKILSKLDSNSRKARVISIILTALAILILGIVTYITAQAFVKYSSLLEKIDEEEEKLGAIQRKVDDLNIKIKEAANSTNGKPECAETRNILTAENTDIDVNPNPTVSNTPLKNSSVTPTPKKVTVADNGSPSAVYVHIVDESQKSDAQKLMNSLENGKFQFFDIETKKVNISQTQIRFFGEGDEIRAKDLAQLLRNKGISARVLKINYNSDKQNLPLEIWFSNDAFEK